MFISDLLRIDKDFIVAGLKTFSCMIIASEQKHQIGILTNVKLLATHVDIAFALHTSLIRKFIYFQMLALRRKQIFVPRLWIMKVFDSKKKKCRSKPSKPSQRFLTQISPSIHPLALFVHDIKIWDTKTQWNGKIIHDKLLKCIQLHRIFNYASKTSFRPFQM